VLRITGRRLETGDALAAVQAVLERQAAGEDVASNVSIDGAADAITRAVENAARDRLLDLLGERPAALVVDDAQWLDAASLRVVVAVAERAEERDVTLVVTHRPAPGDAALAALDAALGRRQPLVFLGALDDAEVAELAAIVLDAPVDDRLVDALLTHSGGMPALVTGLARAWADEGLVSGGRLESAPGRPSESLVAAVAAEVDQLPDAARTVLRALSAGADLDDDLLRATTDLAPDALGEATDALHAAGLVPPGAEDTVPAVAAAVTELTPVAERRRFHARLAAALSARSAPATAAAEHLVAADAQGRDAAEAFAAAGDATLAESPELATEWFERAIAAGTPAVAVAARRAEAAAAGGDVATALRLADGVLSSADAVTDVDRGRALAVVAALMPGRGFWGRSAATYRDLATGPAGAGDSPAGRSSFALLAALGAFATGDRAGADAALADGAATGDGPRALEHEAVALTAASLLATLDSGASQSLSAVLEAAELIESAHSSLLLPDSPHAVGTTVAIALSELNTAEHLLTRALDHGVGGPSLRDRHRLLLGWVGVRTGRWAVAQAALDDVRAHSLAPRDLLLAGAIDAGLSRRSGDLARLGSAWQRTEGVLLRHPADLFSLEVIGELAISAARLGLWDRVSPKARELGDVVRSLGEPALWLLPLRWTGLQVALATDDHEAVVRRAAEVEALPPVHPRLGALADAARTRVAILGGKVDPDGVAAAARGLQGLGLTWEASRLTGQAAIRSADPSVTRALLEHARDLKAALPTSDPAEVPSADSVLSEREQMVAQFIVDGLTHKEIGAQLYISPKTVEHHVAKIRQKLGATTRAEMLAALRSQLSV
jgi:DNA-binding CsgD family transcriptional regulator